MPIEETAARFLAGMAEGPRLQDLTLEGRRAAFDELCATIGPKCTESVEVRDLEVAGPASPLHVRLYVPRSAGDEALPVLYYIHGGGFEMGNVEAYDGWCRYFAHNSGYLTVSVDYRLIPEHPFPSGADDTWRVLHWIRKNIAQHGGDPDTIVVAGDSAGGSLAASAAVRAFGNPDVTLAGQVLIYPATDWSDDWPSMRELPHGRMFVSRDTFRWTRGRYIADERDFLDPLASPLRAADLSGMPPALVVTAEYDPLRDQGEAYGAKLVEAGVPVRVHRYVGQIHGFVHVAEVVPAGYEALRECCRWLESLRVERAAQQVPS